MGRSFISIWEAIELLKSHARLTDVIRVPVMECLDHVLAENVYTRIDQPPFPRSAMDGYALRAADTQGVDEAHPVSLKVARCQYAGAPYFRKLKPGEALQIMTGAAIPAGADAVIRQEDTDCGTEEVTIYASVKPKENYCEIGEDFRKGELLAPAGSTADAYFIAAAVAAGIEKVRVYRPVRVAVITTGDELQNPGEMLCEGHIYNSNLALFSVRFKQSGCQVVLTRSVGDDRDRIADAIRDASVSCDLVVTTGGVSVGIKDLLPEVMEHLGAEILFHGISIKPGMPTMASVYQGMPIISLSGNPYSAAVVFELLVQSQLAVMTGRKDKVLKKVIGIAQDTFPKKTRCIRFLRGYYDGGHISFGTGQRNGQTKAGIGTNCLICLEAGRDPVKVGDELTAYLI